MQETQECYDQVWAVSGQVAVVDDDTCVRFQSRGFGDLGGSSTCSVILW